MGQSWLAPLLNEPFNEIEAGSLCVKYILECAFPHSLLEASLTSQYPLASHMPQAPHNGAYTASDT